MPRADVFPKLSGAVAPPPGAAIALSTIEPSAAKDLVERIVKEGVLRPFDIATASVEEPRPLWMPFWRVEVRVDGLHLDVTELRVGRDGRKVSLPTGASRYWSTALMIPARTAFPYHARLASLTAAPPLFVGANELTTTDVEEAMAGVNAEIVDPDVTRDTAESRALGLLIRGVSPTHALHTAFEPRVEHATFCWYPVYYTRYTYTGEARRRSDEAYFVALSARNAQVLAEAHPSALRATLAKVRRLLSLDHRRY